MYGQRAVGNPVVKKFMNSRNLFASAALSSMLVLAAPMASGEAVAPGLDLDDYRGKVVVVDFWASWCVPCRRSFPWLNAMHAKYQDDGLVIIGVNLDKADGDAAEFLQEFPADFRIIYDPNATLAEQFGVRGMPSSYVISRDGEIAAEHLGFKVKRQDEYEATLAAALGEKTE